jgi:hypothetical protein
MFIVVFLQSSVCLKGRGTIGRRWTALMRTDPECAMATLFAPSICGMLIKVAPS